MLETPVYFYLLAFFSVAGWGLECVYRSVAQKKLVNPGFLKGPYLPIYGTAAVVLTLIIASIHEGAISYAANFIPLVNLKIGALNALYLTMLILLSKGLAYFLVTTGIELATGLFFGGLLKRPLWDYSGQPLCFKNQVCLKYSCYWVLLAFFSNMRCCLYPFSFTGLSTRIGCPQLRSPSAASYRSTSSAISHSFCRRAQKRRLYPSATMNSWTY